MIDDELLLKHNEIWEKLRNTIKIEEIESQPVYNEKYLKAKLIFYKGNIFTVLKYQNKVLIVFVYQQYWLIQYIEKTKTVILKCFSRM